MTLPISPNEINMMNLQLEYGGTSPVSLNEYYGRGNAPASGAISLADFQQSSVVVSPVSSGLLFELDARNPSSYSGSGTTWFDTTVNDRDFTLVNGPIFSSANEEFSFDGANDYTEIADAAWIPEGTSAKTFECYVKMNAWRTGQVAFLTSKTSPNNQSCSFGFKESGGVVTLVLGTQGGGNFSESTDAYTLPTPSNYLNSYHYYSFTYNGSVAKMYIDGALVFTSASGKAFHSNSAPMRMMAFDPSNASFFWAVSASTKGARMYDRALSDAEILTNYNSWNSAIEPVDSILTFSPSVHSGTTFTANFNFNQSIADFTSSDIVVTNGIKGTFTGVTTSQYTLDITPNSPSATITVGVPTTASFNAGNKGNNLINASILFSTLPSTNLYMHLDANNSSSYSGSGTTWLDLTVNDNDFTLNNGPVFNNTSPKHFDFDGTNDNAYRSFSVSSTSEATWIVWFRMNVAGTSQDSFAALFGIRYGTGSTNILGFRSNTGVLGYHWNDNYFDVNTGLSPSVDTWYMLSLRINSTSGRFDLKTGTTTSTFTNTASHGTFSHSGSDAYISRDPEAEGRSFNGDISQILIYTRRLSDSEIDAVYDLTKITYGF